MPKPRAFTTLRLLGLLPVAIAILWVAGMAHLRNYPLSGMEWATLVAGGFALHAIGTRMWPPRPAPKLPEGATPGAVAALAAAMVAVLAAIVGGGLEHWITPARDATSSWALRTLWHTACVFAFSYCGFLHRLLTAPKRT